MTTKYAACSYLTLGYSIAETAAIVREAGYTGIEWRVHPDGQIRPDSLGSDVAEARRAQAAECLTPVCVSSYQPLLDPVAAERDLGVAAELGCPRIRLLWPPYDGSRHAADAFLEARRAMDALAPRLERLGLTMVFETHRGSMVPTASAARRLVEGYPPRLYSVLYDPPNGVTSGLEDPRYAIDTLGEYLAHVQFKNVGWLRVDGVWQWTWMSLDEGMIDWQPILAHLRLRGWDDWLSNENFLLIAPDRRPGVGSIYEGLASWTADVDVPLAVRLGADRERMESWARIS